VAHVIEIRPARCDDVDHAEDFLMLAIAIMVVPVIVIAVIEVVRMTMRMAMVMVVVVIVVVIVPRGRAGVVEPELRNGIPDDSPQRAHASQCVAQVVFHIGRQRKE